MPHFAIHPPKGCYLCTVPIFHTSKLFPVGFLLSISSHLYLDFVLSVLPSHAYFVKDLSCESKAIIIIKQNVYYMELSK